MDLSEIVNTPQVHVLPLGYTQHQRELLDMLGRLHSKHVAATLEEGETVLALEEDEMTDDAMFDAFVFHSKQIINHPTMLVDHYMPKNLLLLNSKQNIVRQSQKYHYLNELLDQLSDSKASKTIVVSVTNSREMDLLESILIGKVNLQYYRFSGSSLYYEKNGMFELGGSQSKSSSSSNSNVGASRSLSPEKTNPKIRPRANNQSSTPTSTLTRGRGRGRPRGGRGGRVGRPPLNRLSQLQSDGNSSDNTTASGTPGPTTTTKMREEYSQKISKNNPNFKSKKDNEPANLKVYLILSQQLKYLPNLEDLKLDLLISLDSNCMDFDAVANTMGKVPILKPIVLNSIEHFEWKLRNLGIEGPKISKFLTYLTLASFPQTHINDIPTFDEFIPLNTNLVKWILNGCASNNYPYPKSYDTCIPLKYDDELLKIVNEVSNNYKPQTDLILPVTSPNFTFFDNEKQENKEIDQDIEMSDKIEIKQEQEQEKINGDSDLKKVKPNPTQESMIDIPIHFTYRQYQTFMASQLIQTMQLMKNWMVQTQCLLNEMYLSESNRQLRIDDIVVEMGELYKKDRDLGVLIEAKEKINGKSKAELERVTKMLNNTATDGMIGIEGRFENIESKKEYLNDESMLLIDNEIELLKKRIEELNSEISTVDKSNEELRFQYQQFSSQAAELSNHEKASKSLTTALEKQSKGDFIKLKEGAFNDKLDKLKQQIQLIQGENEHTNKYLLILEKVKDSKSKVINGLTNNNGRTQ